MKIYLVLFVLLLDFGDPTFLLFHEKVPIFYCLKVCPLYCSKREKRDVDYSPIYWDDDELPYPPYIKDQYVPFHGHIIKHWKMTTTKKTTTTEKTTTTTKASTEDSLQVPYFIDDDDLPFHVPRFHYIKPWKTTTEKPTTTTKASTATPTFICAVCIKKCGIPTT